MEFLFDVFRSVRTTIGLTAQNAGEWGVFFAVLAILVTILLSIIQVWFTYLPYLKAKRTTKRIERDFGSDVFEEVQILEAIRYYVEPDCSQVDPSTEEDLRQVAVVREKVFLTVDRFLASEGTDRHLLLLADSGMGKTSFLLNYYDRNRRKRAPYRQRIAVIPLGRPDAINRIRQIKQKRGTTLFLDAFDEDIDAIRDHRSRLREIMEACVDFRRIVITCRTQFFRSDEEIPKETGVVIVAPRRAGESREYKFYKLYLLPLTNKQVERYVKKRFSFWWRGKRRAARRIIAAIPELSIRPMLLVVVPDLIREDRLITELFQLYEFMVESWLERERPWIDKDRLREFSELLAANLYFNRQHRGFERIPRNELLQLKELNASDLDSWRLTARSLLNRDAEGNYKFAHRSIMEYLFVAAFLKGRKECLSVEWTDLMKQLFVSWGRATEKVGAQTALRVIWNADFRKTGLLPLRVTRHQSTTLTRERALGEVSGRLAGVANMRLPSTWQGAFLRVVKHQNKLVVCDLLEDMTWVLADLQACAGEDLPIYRITFRERVRVLENLGEIGTMGRVNWRFPTLDEFDTLFAAEALMGTEKFLTPTEYYWTSDSMVGGGPIFVSSGDEVFHDAWVRHLGVRSVMAVASKKEGYHVYELIRKKQKRWFPDKQLADQFVIISTGAAEDIYYQLIACQETV